MMNSNNRSQWLEKNKAFLTAEDVSQLIDCSIGHVYKMTYQNKIPSIKIGRYRRYRAIDILLWIESKGGRF